MAEFLSLYGKNLNQKDIEKIAEVFENGGLVIYPTDTVYALGCLSSNASALKRFEKIKGVRLIHAPLGFLFSSISELSKYVSPIDNTQFRMLNQYLPGPFAFLLKAANKLPKPFEKRKTIGCRIVDHPFLESLLPLLSAPLITSSLHDPDTFLDYTTDPQELFVRWSEKIDLFIDCGYGGNKPSTVVDLSESPFSIIRQGLGEL